MTHTTQKKGDMTVVRNEIEKKRGVRSRSSQGREAERPRGSTQRSLYYVESQ